MAISPVGANSILSLLPQLQQRQSLLFSQIASGNRLTSAAVDPAGVSLAQELTAQVNGLNQAEANAGMGLDALRTADSAVQSQSGALQQERQLSLEAANGTLTFQDRQDLQAQISQINQGLNDVASQTQFNTEPLLKGQPGGVPTSFVFQVGANAGQTVQASIDATNTQQLGVANLNVSTQANAQQAIGQTDQALQHTSDQLANIGADENRLSSAASQASSAQGDALSARSLVADENVARASSDLSRSLLSQQFSLFALQQQANSFALHDALLLR